MSGSRIKSETTQTCVTVAGVYRQLVILAFESLGCEVQVDGDMATVTLSAAEQPFWNDQAELRLQFDASEQNGEPPVKVLWQRLAQTIGAIHAAPRQQPTRVHQLTDKLFAPYNVAGGRPHLVGCSLDPRPFLAIKFSGTDAPAQAYLDETGQMIALDLPQRLGMLDLIAAAEGHLTLSRNDLRAWIDALAAGNQPADFPPAAVVWCRYASGKLAFRIEEEEVQLSFEGWACDIASSHAPMPPYRCPLSGRESYNIVADDQGRITVAEAIAKCEVSGQRVIETDLEICQDTGRRALKEYLATCEQTHRRILKSALLACETCRRQLASVSLSKGRCETCRSVTPVSKDDPTLARLLHQYKKLDAWNGWRIGETPQLFIFTAASWTQKLLLVVDKHSLEVSRMATKSRLGKHWTDAPPKLREELTS